MRVRVSPSAQLLAVIKHLKFKRNSIVIVSVVVLTLLVLAVYRERQMLRNEELKLTTEFYESKVRQPIGAGAHLSFDRREILIDSKNILNIQSPDIYNWFLTQTELCSKDGFVRPNTLEISCTTPDSFRKYVEFKNIYISPDNKFVGFEINTDLDFDSGDSVIGILHLENNKVNFVTNFYLGNVFISFSPNGKYFVYKGSCFEGLCGLYVRNSETLEIVSNVNNPEYDDTRQFDSDFVRWVSENEFEYKIGNINKIISI